MPENYEARREAERALLGALLIESTCDGQAISEVKKILSRQDFMDAPFHKGQHARIFKAMTHLEYPHIVSVAEELNNTGELESGDCAYLSGLVADCPNSIIYMDYAQTVLNYSAGKKKPKYKDGVG